MSEPAEGDTCEVDGVTYERVRGRERFVCLGCSAARDRDLCRRLPDCGPHPFAWRIKAKIRGTHHHSFRPGEWADIIGVRIATPDGCDPRPCFLVQYEDSKTDLVPISDAANYEISRGEE